MHSEGSDGRRAASKSPNELVFALCHEVGNLLAGARLEASLMETVSDAGSLTRASERISEISARAGSLLALVHPLLAPSDTETLATDPLQILQGLRRGLDASCDERVGIDLDSAAQLPDARIAAEVLHHLLLTEIFFGLEAAGQARVAASVRGDRVVFRVENTGIGKGGEESGGLHGRPLAHAIARVLLSRQGGQLEVSHADDHTRVDLVFPATAR